MPLNQEKAEQKKEKLKYKRKDSGNERRKTREIEKREQNNTK